MTDITLTESECWMCGDEFEPGDTVYALWSGEAAESERDGGLGMNYESLDLYHARCMSVSDGRPTEYRLHVHRPDGKPPRVHSMRTHTGVEWKDGPIYQSGCGHLRNVEHSDVVSVRTNGGFTAAVREAFPDGPEPCGNCQRLVDR